MKDTINGKHLSPDEGVVVHYLLKLCNRNISNLCRKDLRYLLQDYSYSLLVESVGEEMMNASGLHAIDALCHSYLDSREQECADAVLKPVDEARTPVICYRCKKPHHIARGCKEFSCFRCFETGHVARGCRKPYRQKRTESCTGAESAFPDRPSEPRVTCPVPKPRLSVRKFQQPDLQQDHPLSDSMTSPSTEGDICMLNAPETETQLIDMCGDEDESCVQTDNDAVEDISACMSDIEHDVKCEDEEEHIVQVNSDGMKDNDLCMNDSEFSESCYESCVTDLDDSTSDEGVGQHDSDQDSECELKLNVSDDEQDKPPWAYFTTELGLDCSSMSWDTFRQFVVEKHDVLDPCVIADIFQAVEDDIAEGDCNGY